MSDPTPHPTGFPGLDATPLRSGRGFVIGTGIVLAVFLVVILTVGRGVQDDLGLNAGLGFDAPEEPVEVPLTLDGRQIGVAVWDAEGICAEITGEDDTTYRTCATPDPLRPIWAIDAPDTADPGYVILATPQAAASVTGVTTAGEALDGLTQARELRAAWTIIPLPDGAVVDEMVVRNSEGSDLGNALCGVPDAPTGGPERLAGGCLVPQQD